MKNVLKRVLVILLSMALFQACKNEEKDLSKLLLDKDLNKALEFKTRYPESAFNVDSLIEVLEYSIIRSSSNIHEIESFILKFPTSAYSDSAQSLLYRIEWKELKEHTEEARIKEYIDKYPQSPYYKEAEELLFSICNDGTFTDRRDGKNYSWRKIFDQIWMTQNLNYNMSQSFTAPPKRIGGSDLIDFKVGRAYRKQVLWDACPDGWDIPALEDYFYLAFSLGARVHLNSNNLFWDITNMVYSDFAPDLSFGECIDERNMWNKFAPAMGGTSYWTRTLTTTQSRNSNETATGNTRFGWTAKGGYRAGTKELGGIASMVFFDERLAAPLRCLKRKNIGKGEFLPSKSEIITIDGIDLKLSELPAEGLYRKIDQNHNGKVNNLIIMYVGTKMFLFIGGRNATHSNSYTPFRVYYSKDTGDFIVEKFRRRPSLDSGKGTLKFDNGKMILNFYDSFESIKGEYNIIPSEKVARHYL